ncbi:hypothetical protein [Microvirgula aerodenitrificans]|uniref:hypothetical protein n=1 Tax=Microvirgula aerodenitrificans TaxID=57480 RepID=UPI00248D8279|nr:hypothetical protein [Microvirgula aerodenitrificans]
MNRLELQRFAAQPWPVMGFSSEHMAALVMADRERLNSVDIANVVLHDPLLVFQLLRHIGTVDRARTLTDTVCVEHALLLTGVDPFLTHFGHLSSIDTHPGITRQRKRNVAALLARARLAALLVKDWLSIIEVHKVEEFFTGALLYNVPLAFYAIDNDLVLDGDVERAAQRALGEDYSLFVRSVFQAAGLPAKMTELLLGQQDLSRQRLLLRHAIYTANHLASGWWQQDLQSHLRGVAGLLLVPEDQVWASVVQASLTLARSPYTRAYADPARSLPLVAEPPLVSENEFLELDWTDDSRAEMARFELSVCDVMRRIITVFGVERTAYFPIGPDGSLLCRFQIGFDSKDPLISVHVDPAAPGFFASLTARAQAFRATAEQWPTLTSRYPHPFWDAASPLGCVMVSIFHNGKLAGVLYADNKDRHTGIDDEIYARIKHAAGALSA